jgi:hypothetical protein
MIAKSKMYENLVIAFIPWKRPRDELQERTIMRSRRSASPRHRAFIRVVEVAGRMGMMISVLEKRDQGTEVLVLLLIIRLPSESRGVAFIRPGAGMKRVVPVVGGAVCMIQSITMKNLTIGLMRMKPPIVLEGMGEGEDVKTGHGSRAVALEGVALAHLAAAVGTALRQNT